VPLMPLTGDFRPSPTGRARRDQPGPSVEARPRPRARSAQCHAGAGSGDRPAFAASASSRASAAFAIFSFVAIVSSTVTRAGLARFGVSRPRGDPVEQVSPTIVLIVLVSFCPRRRKGPVRAAAALGRFAGGAHLYRRRRVPHSVVSGPVGCGCRPLVTCSACAGGLDGSVRGCVPAPAREAPAPRVKRFDLRAAAPARRRD